MSRNGETVSAFERELASYCGAKYAIAAANGTVTLQAALVALGVKSGDRVATTPLTMAATTIAILNVGAVPVYCDVDPQTWLMAAKSGDAAWNAKVCLPVSLYGLWADGWDYPGTGMCVDDAAQTLRRHDLDFAFTSLSFQASKILNLGEGGALLTDDEELAARARSYLSLGYRMAPTQARIDSATLKSPTFERHHAWPAINGRMNDITAAEGLRQLANADQLRRARSDATVLYLDAMLWSVLAGQHSGLTDQHVPDGFGHDYWTFAVACDTPQRALDLSDAVVKHGGERPYPAWKLTYQEPALRHLPAPSHRVSRSWIAQATGMRVAELPADIDARDMEFLHGRGRGKMAWLKWREGDRESAPSVPSCPIAESLQPRLLQFQTNDLASAERNAGALRKAIEDLS